jgi:hypothetical protein
MDLNILSGVFFKQSGKPLGDACEWKRGTLRSCEIL